MRGRTACVAAAAAWMNACACKRHASTAKPKVVKKPVRSAEAILECISDISATRVELSADEEDDLSFGIGDFFEEGFQPVLKLSAVLRASNHGTKIHRDQSFVVQ